MRRLGRQLWTDPCSNPQWLDAWWKREQMFGGANIFMQMLFVLLLVSWSMFFVFVRFGSSNFRCFCPVHLRCLQSKFSHNSPVSQETIPTLGVWLAKWGKRWAQPEQRWRMDASVKSVGRGSRWGGVAEVALLNLANCGRERWSRICYDLGWEMANYLKACSWDDASLVDPGLNLARGEQHQKLGALSMVWLAGSFLVDYWPQEIQLFAVQDGIWVRFTG